MPQRNQRFRRGPLDEPPHPTPLTTTPPLTVTRAEGHAYERDVARDLVRRGLLVTPILVALAVVGWGVAGGLSAGYAVALVLINFALSAALLGWAGRISLAFLMGAALFGYLLRLGLLTVAVLAVRHQSWMRVVPLCITLVVTHLGLLIWETRYVSLSLAFPALRTDGRKAS